MVKWTSVPLLISFSLQRSKAVMGVELVYYAVCLLDNYVDKSPSQ